MQNTGRVVFISHGGGPLPLLGDKHHQQLVETLQTIASSIDKPEAIVVISAHWEQSIASVTSCDKPELIYDYSGFPAESYSIEYPCSGSSLLANRIADLLNNSAIEVELNEQRGLDHGVFVPLKIMYPQADIPCVQLSLLNSLDPKKHIEMGKALRPLFDSNILIIGSGFSFHNLKAFFSKPSADTKIQNHEFEQWLFDTCTDPQLSDLQREQRLINWQAAPFARFCHPREEHLLPLHVCYGAAQSQCTDYYQVTILNTLSSQFIW